MVKEASVFYFSGYFLTTTDGVETMATVAQHAMKSKQVTIRGPISSSRLNHPRKEHPVLVYFQGFMYFLQN